MRTFDIIFTEVCDGVKFDRKCRSTSAICEAVFKTNGASCNSHCQSLGLLCENGWDNNGRNCEKTHQYVGCTNEFKDQICRCKIGNYTHNSFYLLF